MEDVLINKDKYNLEINISDTSKEGIINNLKTIDQIVCFKNDYKNNIQNYSYKKYLETIGLPLKTYPEEPCVAPRWGDNYPQFVDTRIKPIKEHAKINKDTFVLLIVLGVFTLIVFLVKSSSYGLLLFFYICLVCLFIVVFIVFIKYLDESVTLSSKYKAALNRYQADYNTILSDYENHRKKYQNDVEKYKQYEKEKADIDTYNAELLSDIENKNKYKNYLDEQKQKYEFYDNAKIKAQMKLFLHEDYWGYCKDIIKIIDTGRADTLKEAINLLASDLHAKALLQEQQRKNDIILEDLAKQRELQEKANLEQQNYYQNQLDLEKIKIVENMRHHAKVEAIQEVSTKTVALCANCPKVNYCDHIGKKTSACNVIRKK